MMLIKGGEGYAETDSRVDEKGWVGLYTDGGIGLGGAQRRSILREQRKQSESGFVGLAIEGRKRSSFISSIFSVT